MEAFIVGSEGYYSNDEYIPDGRLLKICPKDVRTKVLLEIEAGNRIYRHRNYKLTEKYKGRTIGLDWITGFIQDNKNLAESLIKEKSEILNPVKTVALKPKSLSEEELINLRSERHIKNCECNGRNESCPNCFGKGFYLRDGLGKKV
jgi:hypothetical protein